VGVQYRLEFYGLKQLKNCFNSLNSTAAFPFGTTKKILLKPVGVQHRQFFPLSSQERVGVRFPPAETPSVSPLEKEEMETPSLILPLKGGENRGFNSVMNSDNLR